MAITTTGGGGSYTRLGGTTATLFTTAATANVIYIVDIVEKITADPDTLQATYRAYTMRAGPSTPITITDDPTGSIVTYSWVGMIIT